MSTSSADDKAPIASPDAVAEELPAPRGWQKKLAPKKSKTSSSKRGTVVFISPAGEEIKSKSQLDRYLKAHPHVGLSSSEFDWGTGETPRRSARISQKTKASEMPVDEPPTKQARKFRPETTEVKEDSNVEMEGASATDREEASAEEPSIKMESVLAADVVKVPPLGGEAGNKSTEEIEGPGPDAVVNTEDNNEVKEDVERPKEDITEEQDRDEESGYNVEVADKDFKENDCTNNPQESLTDNISNESQHLSYDMPSFASSKAEEQPREFPMDDTNPHGHVRDPTPQDVRSSPQPSTVRC